MMTEVTRRNTLPLEFIKAIESRIGRIDTVTHTYFSHCVAFSNDKQEYINLHVSLNEQREVVISLQPDNANPGAIVVTPTTNFTALNEFIYDFFNKAGHTHVSQAIRLAQAVVNSCNMAF